MSAKAKIISNEIPHLKEMLLISIALMFLIAIFFLVSTMYKRIRKIKRTQLKNRYQKIIDKTLFNYLFSDQNYSDIERDLFDFNFAENRLFQKVAIKSIIGLHQNYSGEYEEKLEMFYTQSKLVNYSLRKLASKKWYRKVEGIRDLSNMKYLNAFGQIQACIAHKHEMVQSEALIALVKMKGLEEIINQKDTELFLNDWVQSNLLYTVKTYRINEPENLIELFESKNDSMLLLAVRLMNHFHSIHYSEQLKNLQTSSQNVKLKMEIDDTIERINMFYNKVV